MHRGSNATRVVVAGVVDDSAHGAGRQRFVSTRTERQPLAAQPRRERFRGQDDRHAVVHRRHYRVGGGGQDRARLDDVARPARGKRTAQGHAARHGPALPQAGERQQAAVAAADQIRLPDGARALPFIEPVGRNQAAPAAERGAERRFQRRRLGPRVDEAVGDGRIPGPARDEPPAQHRQPAAVRLQAHGGNVLARRHVVAGRQFQRRPLQGQQVVYLLPGEGLREPPAHGRLR